MSISPDNGQSAFLRTSEIFPEDLSQLLDKLTYSYTDIANSINVRDISLYNDTELLNGHQFFTPGNTQVKKFAFRKCFSFGAIAAGVTIPIPHNITGLVQFTRIYGTCITTLPVTYRPIPYVSVAAANQGIEIYVDNAGNIQIANGAAGVPITSGLVILEYLKN